MYKILRFSFFILYFTFVFDGLLWLLSNMIVFNYSVFDSFKIAVLFLGTIEFIAGDSKNG